MNNSVLFLIIIFIVLGLYTYNIETFASVKSNSSYLQQNMITSALASMQPQPSAPTSMQLLSSALASMQPQPSAPTSMQLLSSAPTPMQLPTSAPTPMQPQPSAPTSMQPQPSAPASMQYANPTIIYPPINQMTINAPTSAPIPTSAPASMQPQLSAPASMQPPPSAPIPIPPPSAPTSMQYNNIPTPSQTTPSQPIPSSSTTSMLGNIIFSNIKNKIIYDSHAMNSIKSSYNNNKNNITYEINKIITDIDICNNTLSTYQKASAIYYRLREVLIKDNNSNNMYVDIGYNIEFIPFIENLLKARKANICK